MSKILFISNISNRITNFVTASIVAAHQLNMDFYQVANWKDAAPGQIEADERKYDIKIKSVPISRNPFSKTNICAYKELVEIVKKERIDYIHCNTPTGGVLGRLVGKKCKVKKVIYEAHGFHFYKGAPIKNWVLYYPVEKVLAHYTDALITINNEDYEFAKHNMRLRNNGKVYYVPGVGIETKRFDSDEDNRKSKRAELNLEINDIAIISMGDLIERKNYETAIRAVAVAQDPRLQYFICGTGPEEERLKLLANKLGTEKQIHFLGFRSDIKELLAAADIFLFTTKQEGLPRSLMEAMASGLPCIASEIRGNTDLLADNGGYLCAPTDVDGFAGKIKKLAEDKFLRETMGRNNLITIHKFSNETVCKELQKIYESELIGGVSYKEYIHELFDYFPLWARKRLEIGVPLDAFVMISVGELNHNKNNGVIISAMEKLKNKNIHYVLCGTGAKQSSLQKKVDQSDLNNYVHFLGYRNDAQELYKASDCFVMPSIREGLSRSIMEAMASGLPCIVSKIRGNTDLIDTNGGYVCNPTNDEEFSETIFASYSNIDRCRRMGTYNKSKIKKYDSSVVESMLRGIYAEVLE